MTPIDPMDYSAICGGKSLKFDEVEPIADLPPFLPFPTMPRPTGTVWD